MVTITQASPDEHTALLAVAKQSKFTRDFSNQVMFSSRAAYLKGWIRKAVGLDGSVVGFTCVRHKVRSPETVLYFIAVDSDVRQRNVGRALFQDLLLQSPSGFVSFNVDNDNAEARAFYARLGCIDTGLPTIGGTATRWEARR